MCSGSQQIRKQNIHQANWNAFGGKYFNKHFKQETVQYGFNG
jgi:hypothetical protein